MAWVRFTADFDWRPNGRVCIAFKKGMTQFVTRRCAAKAIARGKALPAERPKDKVVDDRRG